MLKEMSVNLTENDLVIFCQQVLRFFTEFFLQCILDVNPGCPIDCQVITTVKAQKSMKSIARIVHLPSVVQSELYEATRILLYTKKIKITFSTICLLCVLKILEIILEIIHWMQTVYALLYDPQNKDMFSKCIYTLIWTKIAHPCVAADTEEHTQFAFSG